MPSNNILKLLIWSCPSPHFIIFFYTRSMKIQLLYPGLCLCLFPWTHLLPTSTLLTVPHGVLPDWTCQSVPTIGPRLAMCSLLGMFVSLFIVFTSHFRSHFTCNFREVFSDHLQETSALPQI